MRVSKVEFVCRGMTTMLYGKQIFAVRRPEEKHDQFEERTWRERIVKDEDGNCAISSEAVLRSLFWAAKWLSEKLEKQKTYAARFLSGVISEQAFFPLRDIHGNLIRPESLKGITLSVPSDGRRGGTKRVQRTFPIVPAGWWFNGSLLVLDEAITEDVFARHMQTAGTYDGHGAMRRGKGGPNGMYLVEDVIFSTAKGAWAALGAAAEMDNNGADLAKKRPSRTKGSVTTG